MVWECGWTRGGVRAAMGACRVGVNGCLGGGMGVDEGACSVGVWY